MGYIVIGLGYSATGASAMGCIAMRTIKSIRLKYSAMLSLMCGIITAASQLFNRTAGKNTRVFAPVLTLLILITATSTAYAQQQLNITYVTSPFNVPSIVMQEKGFLTKKLAEMGVKVNSVEITSGAKQTQAMAAGKIDIASVLGSSSAILAKANGAPVEIIGIYSRGPKAYTIMVNDENINSIAALKGKKIAGPKGTVLNQLLAAALNSEKLALTDVDYLNMDLPSAKAALLSGKADAATLAGASALEAEKAGARILVDGETLISPTTVIAANSDWAKQHPELVQAYLSAHQQAVDFVKNHPQEALEIAAKEQKISLDDAQKQFPLYDFDTRFTRQDINNLNADQDFMIKANMLQPAKKIDIRNDLLTPSLTIY